DKTRNILSAEALAKAKKGVLIINCARGGLVDEAALRAGLDSGHIGGAGFDVFVEEPAKDNVLFGAENFIATPHLGASTMEAQENVALQVAEQMSDYLLTGAVSNALNSPSVTADEAPKLKPFVALAERLGAFAGQMVDVEVKAIDIAYEGEVANLNTRPLTAAALAGVMRPMLAEINMVSAPAIARERGISVSESKQDDSPIYESLVRITVTTAMGKRSFAGSVMAGAPRIIEVKGMDLDAPFGSTMLYVNNLDKPGFIGNLGAVLADANV
ncbi:MAG TPA: NAD(P)-dependent oxidoreductase, partial [Phenylobacterium sp.]|nr:NAD(P)-dependent oxidoreductase [Phenylobacterium sp.]